jgi:CRP/FNR family transcriptional regulator, cyclic AMP receptor protein
MTAHLQAQDWPLAPSGRVALLDVDPELAGAFPPEEIPTLRRLLAVPVYRLPRIAELDPPLRQDGVVHLGFLILKGLVLREASVCGRPTAELLGPGDVIQPWHQGEDDMLASTVKWTVLEQTLVGELGPAFAGRISGHPQVVQALMDRGTSRAQALAVQRSIAAHVRVDIRVLAFLWHLAERFGVVIPSGVRVDVPLTHSVLARLVGARRPTVTTALQRLIQLGYLRRENRAFILVGDAGAIEELEARSPSRDFESDGAMNGSVDGSVDGSALVGAG